MYGIWQRCWSAFGSRSTGAAWLSSARAVRCRVKSRNERNPYLQLPASKVGDSGETAGVSREEGGEQTGLDTLVVHALNDVNWLLSGFLLSNVANA